MSKTIQVQVSTIDSEMDFLIPSNTTGKQLFEQVVRSLNIREVWWFGLQYIDCKGLSSWLKLDRKVGAQDLGKASPVKMQLCVKYFPEDVAEELIQEVTQRLFYLQVRQEILASRIFCPAETCVLLASYACQCKYGDFREELIASKDQFIHQDRLMPEKVVEQHEMTSEQWVEKVVIMYRSHQGLPREEAMLEYLKIVQDLEMYGVNFFQIKNKKGSELHLGVDALGLSIYNGNDKLTPKIGFPWSEIRNVSYSNKKFSIKSTDKTSTAFLFYTQHARISKTILNLSMGNHDLYLRRRRAEPIEMQQMRAQAAEDKRARLLLKDKVSQERLAKEEVERRLADMEIRLREAHQQQEEAQRTAEDRERRIEELEELLEDARQQKRELEESQARLAASNEALEGARREASEDLERLTEAHAAAQAEVAARICEVYAGEEALRARQEELEALKHIVQEESHQLEMLEPSGDDRREETRTTVIAGNEDLKAQLRALADDLARRRVEERLDETDHLHRENQRQGRDKFQTLRQIRQGNTKKRIDAFECL